MKKNKYLIFLLILFVSSELCLFAKDFKGAELRTKLSYTYGRFETRLKSAYREGMLSSFFTYYDGGGGISNWNEIDIEVMGRYYDNVQFNTITPGQVNHTGHKPMLNSPHLDYHTYAFEWTPNYVAWFVDGEEVLRQTGAHIATLNKPQKIMMNIWNPIYENWAGVFNAEALPAFAFYDWVSYYAYTPGTGTYGTGNNFTHSWTDNFDSWNTNRWEKGTHTWDGNGCDFIQANAVFADGKLVLCLTNSTNTGYIDLQPPVLLWARAVASNKVLVMFTEEIDQTAAETISNYAIPTITINSASLQPDRKSVMLDVSGLVVPSNKTLAVLSMKDDAPIPNTMNAKATTILMPQILSFPIKINCAGPAALDYLTDASWTKDTDYGVLDGSSTNYASSLQINNTDEDVIFQSEKYGMVTYKVRVPNGNYNVNLMFAENYFTSSGKRVFDVYLEQNRVLENFDIYLESGNTTANIKEFLNINVSDYVLDIQFAEKIDNALINGIVITPSTTDIEDEQSYSPVEFKVEQNYPNPFNSSTQINYSLADPDNITFKLFDILGRQILTEDLGFHSAGSYTFNFVSGKFNDYSLTSGVYFYSFSNSSSQVIRKMILLN